jgi:hypothetical protein
MVQNLSHLPELEIEDPPRFCILAFVDFAYGACGELVGTDPSKVLHLQ